jgi:Flp pilus assembly protein TadD
MPQDGMDEKAGNDKLHALFAAGALEAARAFAEALLDREPEHAEALHVLGLVSYREGHPADAIALMQRSVAISPQASTLSNLGAAFRARGKPDDAEAAYHQALSMQPDLANASTNLANLLIAANRLAEAEIVLTQAVEHHPHDPGLRQRLDDVAYMLRAESGRAPSRAG